MAQEICFEPSTDYSASLITTKLKHNASLCLYCDNFQPLEVIDKMATICDICCSICSVDLKWLHMQTGFLYNFFVFYVLESELGVGVKE